jgi:hypothetical protein
MTTSYIEAHTPRKNMEQTFFAPNAFVAIKAMV